jgi:hypothetical protein
VRGKYRTGGRMALKVVSETGEPYGVLTVNLPERELSDDELFVKTYDENARIAAAVLKLGIFEETKMSVRIGFADVSVWRIADRKRFEDIPMRY